MEEILITQCSHLHSMLKQKKEKLKAKTGERREMFFSTKLFLSFAFPPHDPSGKIHWGGKLLFEQNVRHFAVYFPIWSVFLALPSRWSSFSQQIARRFMFKAGKTNFRRELIVSRTRFSLLIKTKRKEILWKREKNRRTREKRYEMRESPRSTARHWFSRFSEGKRCDSVCLVGRGVAQVFLGEIEIEKFPCVLFIAFDSWLKRALKIDKTNENKQMGRIIANGNVCHHQFNLRKSWFILPPCHAVANAIEYKTSKSETMGRVW